MVSKPDHGSCDAVRSHRHLDRSSSRRTCRVVIASTSAAEAEVRLPERTSVKTSMRRTSRSLISTQPIVVRLPGNRPKRAFGHFYQAGGGHFYPALITPVAAKLICLSLKKVEMSKFNSSRRAVGMW